VLELAKQLRGGGIGIEIEYFLKAYPHFKGEDGHL